MGTRVHGYTTHGHRIEAIATTEPQPIFRMRCGGIGLCDSCSREAAMGNHPAGSKLSPGPEEFQLRPERIQAMRISKTNAQVAAEWCGGEIVEEISPTDANDTFVGINVPSLAGPFRVSEGQYLIRDEKGHFHARAKSSFENKYLTN